MARPGSWFVASRSAVPEGQDALSGEAREHRGMSPTADKICARMAEVPDRWNVIAQLPDEEAANGVLAQLTTGHVRVEVGEWEIVVREDKRRARSGGAFVVWARRASDGEHEEHEERTPVGRWVRAVRLWALHTGITALVEASEDPAEGSIRGFPPRIVDEDLRRQLIDRLPRASSFARDR